MTGVGCERLTPRHSVEDMRPHDSLSPDSPDLSSGAPLTVPSAPPPPRLPVWARVLLPTVLFLPLALAGSILMVVPGYADLLQRTDGVGVTAYAPYAGVVLAAYVLASWALLRWVDRRPLRALGLRFGRRAVLGLLAGYAIAQVITLLAGWATQALGIARTLEVPESADQTESAPVLALLVFLVLLFLRAFMLQGIGEEVLFRGYLLQSLRRWPVLGVVIAAVAFTIPHLASGGGQQSAIEHLLYLAAPFGFAISAGFLAIALRSVWAAVGIHGGFHLATVGAAIAGLTADGPAMWVALGLGHLVAGVVIAALVPRERWAEVREHGPYGRAAA